MSESSNIPPRATNHQNNPAFDESVAVQRTTDKCDREIVSNNDAIRDEHGVTKPEIEVSTELEVTLPEATNNISMNSLLSPLNQTYQETEDNNSDLKADGMPISLVPQSISISISTSFPDNCPDAKVQPAVKSQSTSPNIPCDSEVILMNNNQSTPPPVEVSYFFFSIVTGVAL